MSSERNQRRTATLVGRRRQRQEPLRRARTRRPRRAWRRRTRTPRRPTAAARASSRRTRPCCRRPACHISSMPGPRPLKRVPISETSTARRSGRRGCAGRAVGPLLHEPQLAEERLVLLARLLQQRHRDPDQPDGHVGRLVRIAMEVRVGDAGQVEAEAPVGDAGRARPGSRPGSSNHTILPPSTACTPQFDASVLKRVSPRPVAASLPYSLMRREGGVAVGHVDPDAVREDVEGDAHRGRRVQHCVGDQLGRQERGVAGDLRRQIAQMGGDPVARHRACSPPPARGAASTCHPVTYPQAGRLCVRSVTTGVVEAEHDDVVGALLGAQHGGEGHRRDGRASRPAQSPLRCWPAAPCPR